jgi:hypothetical protein
VVNKVEENMDAVDLVEDRIIKALEWIRRVGVNGEVRLEIIEGTLMFRIVLLDGDRLIQKRVPWLSVRLCISNTMVDIIRQMHEELSRAA